MLIPVILISADWVLRVGLSLRIIMCRRGIGPSLGWISIILLVPLFGSFAYLMVGETRLGRGRAARAVEINERNRARQEEIYTASPADFTDASSVCELMHRHGWLSTGFGALAGNELTLIDDCERTLRTIIEDVDRARHSCHMEFYIWSVGGTADEVAAAVIRAAGRGVQCRILVDAVGSGDFLESEQAGVMRQAGVEVVAALPVGIIRALFRRIDLRLHRKIVVIDGEIAYMGSLNLADARHFKRDAGVGEWVDAMVRITGPAAEALALIFLQDWELETEEPVEQLEQSADLHHVQSRGGVTAQVVPSGPGASPRTIHDMLVSTIYAARERLVITSPYFAPDEAMLAALTTAAMRGVQVTLVLPERIDSPLVRYASRSHYQPLLEAGVRIMLYRSGLLHAKTITVDDEISCIGSVNMDMRSFWLNFEVTLFVYHDGFNDELRYMQARYISESDPVELNTWSRRRLWQRVVENTLRLVSPML
ncbi:MAG: cardiolipin synthase [Phycisphaerales bacterium]|nr:cardiolipin synthase [Phycisphaerales bacterium]